MQIPLFPLHVVLFPGMILPLRIFEPRYRLMFQRCMETDRRFGVVLIREGQEVGAAAEPYAVGTLAEITDHEMQPDGTILLACVGLRRFLIEKTDATEPYLQAEVALIDEGDPAAPLPGGLVESAQGCLDEYLALLATVTTMKVELPAGGLSSIDLSYLMSAALQLDNGQKQQLLEIPHVGDRLEHLVALCREETGKLKAYVEKSHERGDFFFKGNRLSRN